MHNLDIKNFNIENDKTILTFRWTPPPITEEQESWHEDMADIGLAITQLKHVSRFLLYEEVSEKQVLHYHGRINTSMTYDWWLKYVIQILPNFTGNGMKQNKLIREHGKTKPQYEETLWKSKTYIAKEGQLIIQKGYTEDEINFIQSVGSALNKTAPIFRKICIEFNLNNDSTGYSIEQAIVDYYAKSKKHPPKGFHYNNLIHNILLTCNEKYRMQFRRKNIYEIDKLIWEANSKYKPNYNWQNVVLKQ